MQVPTAVCLWLQQQRQIWTAAFHDTLPHPLALKFFLSLSCDVPWAFGRWRWVDVGFKVENSSVTYSQHFDQMIGHHVSFGGWGEGYQQPRLIVMVNK